jgi:K+-sensing histidine kinase KdpD
MGGASPEKGRGNRRQLQIVLRLHFSKKYVHPGSLNAYLLAAVLIAAATALRVALDAELQGVQFITMFPAIIATTLICGLRAGTFSLISGILCSWYFIIPPTYSIKIGSLPNFFALLFFVLVGGLVVIAIGGIRILLEHVLTT